MSIIIHDTVLLYDSLATSNDVHAGEISNTFVDVFVYIYISFMSHLTYVYK